MKKGRVFLLAALAWGLAGTAGAECTADEAQAKADLVSRRIAEVAPEDPPKAVAVAQEVGARIPEFQNNPQGYDIEGLCAFYDEMLQKLE